MLVSMSCDLLKETGMPVAQAASSIMNRLKAISTTTITCKHDDEMVIRQSIGLDYTMTALITCLQRLYRGCNTLIMQFEPH